MVLVVCHWFKYFYGWRSFTQISHIITNSQVSVYADFNRQPKTAFGVLIGFLAKFFFFLNQQIITEGIANDTTDYSYWDRERSLNALEREQWGRWPLIACIVCKCQVPNAKRLDCVNNKIFESVWFSAALVYWLIQDQNCPFWPVRLEAACRFLSILDLRFYSYFILIRRVNRILEQPKKIEHQNNVASQFWTPLSGA